MHRWVSALIVAGCGRYGFDAIGSDATAVAGCDGGTVYVDGDGDDWGGAVATGQCDVVAGTTSNSGDCDDGDSMVNPDANDDCQRDRNCDGMLSVSVPSSCPLIQPLLDLSVAMAIPAMIALDAGVHVENLRFTAATATVTGVGPGVSVLQGTGSGPVVVFQNDGTVAQGLSGMTVTGGVCEIVGMACC